MLDSRENVGNDRSGINEAQGMKVYIVSSAFQPAWDWGGPIRSIWNLARGLASMGVDVNVLTTNARQVGIVDIPRIRREEGVRIVTSPIAAGGISRFANRQGISSGLWKSIINETVTADIVQIEGFWGPTPLVAGEVCQLYNKPYVVSTRGTLEIRSLNEKAWKKRIALKCGAMKFLNRASALHYTTIMEKSLSPEWAKSFKSFVIPNSIEIFSRTDGKLLRENLEISDQTVLYGIFGRLHPRKGFDILLPAFGKKNATRNNRKLLVVGPDENGYRRKLEKMVEEYQLEDCVVFAGELAGDSLRQAYSAVDIIALPSHGESFGNVIVEAAAYGKPCIISDKVGLKDWVENNDIGIVLQLNVNLWENAINDIGKKEIVRRWETKRLEKIAREGYSIESVARQMKEQYEQIVRNTTQRS
jgi:glycosyltransferase involved in cell wall biosynthesis